MQCPQAKVEGEWQTDRRWKSRQVSQKDTPPVMEFVSFNDTSYIFS